MTTPIVDFVKKYAESNALRLHMPGHKGRSLLGVEALDITEIEGADVLYSAQGIIKQSEENAARLFGTKKTVYSAEGSSLAIRAMLYLAKMQAKAENKPWLIAAGRNAHKSFVTACALLNLEVDWLLPQRDETLISCDITADFLDAHLSGAKEKPVAVFVTSPDYLGTVLDIKELSKVCEKHGVLLLVDNAHGAYLKFLPESRHPITLGAHMCCDSAHKTLPALTGSAYLHIAHSAPQDFCEKADTAMSLFASTSPSYLILQSLDMLNKYLSEDYQKSLAEFKKKVDALKDDLMALGFTLLGDEPLKLTIAPKDFGYTGYELAKILARGQIVCEFSDPDFTVMMLSLEIGTKGLDRIKEVLSAIQRKPAITTKPPRLSLKEKRLSLNEALFSPSKEFCVDKCCGKIMATPTVACPPAIPIVVCGEEIDSDAVKTFEYYGITSCFVLDK